MTNIVEEIIELRYVDEAGEQFITIHTNKGLYKQARKLIFDDGIKPVDVRSNKSPILSHNELVEWLNKQGQPDIFDNEVFCLEI